jgi:putative ABC transport system permease protein
MVNALAKKTLRDARGSAWPFTAAACVCALGIALFCGINLYASTMRNAVQKAYDSALMADVWAYKATVTDEDLAKIQALSFVSAAQRRKSLDAGVSGALSARLRIHAADGGFIINVPELLEGEPLTHSGAPELLLDSRFAEANHLSPGDLITLSTGESQESWLVKGIARSAEYIYYAPDGLTVPNHENRGFAYASASSLPQAPWNELVIMLGQEKSVKEITTLIRKSLGSANIITRAHQPSASYIEDDLMGVSQLGTLFPIVFLLIAALVTWITTGRMMETQRQHLGSLRALGFSKMRMLLSCSLHGAVIAVPGTVLGWIASIHLGEFLLSLSTSRYTLAPESMSPWSIHLLWATMGVAIATLGAALLSCGKSLKSVPASLMRPKPPAPGHRILLERIAPFWRRLSFSGKIVSRNLFRNKARLLMGLLGIIGSTAMILCGFGMRDSTQSMLRKAFDQSMNYDMEIKLRAPLSSEEAISLCEPLKGALSIDANMAFGVYIYADSGAVLNPYLVVLEDSQDSLVFMDKSGNLVPLPASGVLITPRMAKALGTSIGSPIVAERLDGSSLNLEVAGIVDFPVGNEIYISQSAFSKISSLPFAVSVLLVRGQSDPAPLDGDPRISLIETKTEMKANVMTVLELLQSLQAILIAFAALLAFSVMMVLGGLNFQERIRELATLKVLGFHPNEMKRLVLRENIWISVLGLPFGAALGYGLIVLMQSQTSNPDMEVTPSISLSSVLLGFAMMIAFALFANFLSGRKMKKVNMVASLKAY